jgi:DNA invertase Pin-like site-specific DNA recombinase
MPTPRVALYLRVSTDGQTTENQRRELLAVAERSGWNVVATFEDAGISGTNGRDKRPGFDKLMKGIARKQFDMVAAWSVDRLGRSLTHLVAFLEELRAKGLNLYLHQQGLDTSTPAGRALFQMMGVFSEFERAMIVERVKAGLARAKAQGRRLGRREVAADIQERVETALRSGVGINRAAKAAGVGNSVAQRIARRLREAAPTEAAQGA